MLLLMLSILIGGCATPIKWNPTPEEQQSIRKVGLVVNPELDKGDFWVVGATGGLLAGAAWGFLGGLLPSWAWYIGGPFVTTPYLALEGALCHSELSSIENPEQHFQEVFKRLELPSRLKIRVLDVFVSGAPANELFVEVVPSLNQESRLSYANSRGLDTLLELKIMVRLESYLNVLDGTLLCFPRLRSKVTATLQRVSDGTIIAKAEFWEGYSKWESSLTFQKMLTDESVIVENLDDHYIHIAKKIIKWISTPPP
jgi:hypothetical protein